MIGFEHRPRGAQRQQLGCVVFVRHGEGGVVHRRAAILQRDENLVLVQQLVHCLHGGRYLVLAVLHDVMNFAAVDAAFGIDRVDQQPDGVGVVDALDGGDAGQVGDRADQNFGIGHAMHRFGG